MSLNFENYKANNANTFGALPVPEGLELDSAFLASLGYNNVPAAPSVSAFTAPTVPQSTFLEKQRAAASPWNIPAQASQKAGVQGASGIIADTKVVVPPEESFSSKMSNYGNLATGVSGLVSAFVGMKNSNIERKALRQNMAQVEADNAFRDNAKANINRGV